METEKTVKLSLKDISRFSEDNDPELAIANIAFLSTDENTHKIHITEDLLKRDCDTVLGKWLVGEMNFIGTDVTTHTDNQVIFGYIPPNQEVKFNYNENDCLVASVQAVVSKIYATNFYNIFLKENIRNVSVEMQIYGVDKHSDGSMDITGFNINGITVLRKSLNGSCPDAKMEMVRFSEEDAEKYYNATVNSKLSKFVEERKQTNMKSYKIDTSEKAVVDTPWGDVDKTELRNTILKSKNKSTLVKAVYLLVEDGWETAPSEHLKYPVMQLVNDTFVYNRNALSSAKAYAEKENETVVLSKLNKIYNSLGIGEKEMVDEKQFAELEQELAECKTSLAEKDELITSKDAEIKELQETLEKKTVDEASLAEKDEIIMSKDAEIKELQEFKFNALEKEKVDKTNAFLSQIKNKVSNEEYSTIETKFKECEFDQFDAVKNEVFASIGEKLVNLKDVQFSDGIVMRKSEDNDNKAVGLWG